MQTENKHEQHPTTQTSNANNKTTQLMYFSHWRCPSCMGKSRRSKIFKWRLQLDDDDDNDDKDDDDGKTCAFHPKQRIKAKTEHELCNRDFAAPRCEFNISKPPAKCTSANSILFSDDIETLWSRNFTPNGKTASKRSDCWAPWGQEQSYLGEQGEHVASRPVFG